MSSLELKVNDVVDLPAITFNYKELKKELEIRVSTYLTKTYTEDDIKEAKEDRAKLNNLVKAINSQKIAKKNEYMEKYNQFEIQIKEIMAIIEKGSNAIDSQVKAFEEKQKEEKRTQIKEYFDSVNTYKFIKLERIFDEKWLNSTVTIKSIQKDIDNIEQKTSNDIEAIKALESKYESSLISKYEETLDIGRVILEKSKLEKIDFEMEQEKLRREKINQQMINDNSQEETKMPQKSIEDISTTNDINNIEKTEEILHRAFKIWGTKEQIIALGKYMNNMKIKFEKIEGVN